MDSRAADLTGRRRATVHKHMRKPAFPRVGIAPRVSDRFPERIASSLSTAVHLPGSQTMEHPPPAIARTAVIRAEPVRRPAPKTLPAGAAR